ncbi:MAG: integrase arm-type DNA-binding domain-containing protein [Azospirillaceae bacterium]
MKPRRPHPDRALSAVKVRALTEPGRYADGNGLYLVVDPSGAKRWMLRTVVHGRRRDIGLGSARLVTLAEAREKARDYRKVAREGGDPLTEIRAARRVVPTFAEAAVRVHGDRTRAWRNAKHARQWLSSLETHVFPVIGGYRVDRIETADVLRVLAPLWLAKPETARRLRQRIATVLDWAKAAGFRTGDNPVEGVAGGLPRQPDRQAHHAALPYTEVPAFVRRLRTSDASEPVRLAFEFLIVTAARTGEVREARWGEIDLAGGFWTVPGNRMKAGRPHRVPLAPRVVAILERARALAGDSDLVFPGRSPVQPLSGMTFLMTLRRMGMTATVHGFRSAFRDWAAERTAFSQEVCEMALAHTIRNKAEAAYRRGDLLEKRRALMTAWAYYVAGEAADVVPLRTG